LKLTNLFKKKDKKTTSLHVELFRYFLVFTAVLLVLTWVFQITLLGSTYRKIRSTQIISAGKQLKDELIQETFTEFADSISIEKNMGVIVLNLQTGELLQANQNLINSLINRMDVENMMRAVVSQYTGNDMVFYIDEKGTQLLKFNRFNSDETKLSLNDSIKALVYVSQVNNANNEPLMLITIGSIVPVETITSTIKAQVLTISIIMVICSLIISYFASKYITKPLTAIASKAKQLAKGDFSTTFEADNIQEINDLSNTLNQMTKDLSKADELKKDLIANISHDLRTPLTMISGYGELIRDIPSENNKENIQVIIDEANRLASLVNNLLDISKLQAGNETISLSDVNLNQLIYKVVDSFNKMLETKGLKLIFEPLENDCYVKCDPIRIQQVIYNLVNNALNHCGKDNQVIISLEKKENKIITHIIDHGEGINEEELKDIWNRYYKAKNKGRYEAGSGLGLSIVKTILDLHQTEYGVHSKIGEGSDFYFSLTLSDN